MQAPQPQSSPVSESSATETSNALFVETIEHRRFVEFCDACRQFRYIGLCYGSPGLAAIIPALRHSPRRHDSAKRDRWTTVSRDDLPIDTVFYTTSVVNSPSRIESEISRSRESLMEIALRPIRRAATETLDAIRIKDEARRREITNEPGRSPCDRPAQDPSYLQTYERFEALKRTVPDPTTLILVDEADRLQMNSLEMMRSIFDAGKAGMVLIGMPGIEKRIARFPQFYSRIGFVHEFRTLEEKEITELLNQGWVPVGVTLPSEVLAPDVIASLIRMSGGNFRLLTRLRAQIRTDLEGQSA